MSWAKDAIGTKPENCWTFVRDIYNEQLGVELPEFASEIAGDISSIVKTMKIEKEQKRWSKTDNPKEFSVVAMSKGEYIHHVGVFTEQDGGKIVHAFNEDPVVANDPLQLKRMGFKRIEFYEFG